MKSLLSADRLRHRKVIGLLAACVLINVSHARLRAAQATNALPLPFYNTAEFTPEWIERGSTAHRIIHRIADFSLTNQAGATVTATDFCGRIYVANFFFTTCPGICMRMTQNLKRVQDAFASDPQVVLLSHSVTPALDTPAVLSRYGQSHRVIQGKWHLVTGPKSVIYDLARNSYFAEVKSEPGRDETEFVHSERVLLIDRQRRIRGVYNGTLALDMERLIEDIRTLESESNWATIGGH